jgi:hypothetical protein
MNVDGVAPRPDVRRPGHAGPRRRPDAFLGGADRAGERPPPGRRCERFLERHSGRAQSVGCAEIGRGGSVGELGRRRWPSVDPPGTDQRLPSERQSVSMSTDIPWRAVRGPHLVGCDRVSAGSAAGGVEASRVASVRPFISPWNTRADCPAERAMSGSFFAPKISTRTPRRTMSSQPPRFGTVRHSASFR